MNNMRDVLIHLAVILGVIALTFFVGGIFSSICLFKDKVRKKIKSTNNLSLGRAFDRLSVWYKATILWTITEYFFVILPFACNVVVIYLTNTDKTDTELVLMYSIISLSFVAFGYAINPQRHKKCYRRAFCCLDNSINEYLTNFDAGNPNTTILDKGIKDGEECIDSSYDIE